jgi:hypothetical protein
MIISSKWRFAQRWFGQIFSINIPSLRGLIVSTLKRFIVLRWLLDLRTAYIRRKQRKKIEYCEKRWEMKLRGLRR